MRLGLIENGGALRAVVVSEAGTSMRPLACTVSPGSGAGDPAVLAEALATASATDWQPLDTVRLRAPVPFPPRVFGIGLNYRDHAAETGREPPSVQTWFMKQPTAVNPPFADVEKPPVSDRLDYEAEVVVVIGRRCRHVPAARASEVIAGFAVGCDYSVRDWQRATPTMIMGKGFDTHAPFGPWLTTLDEAGGLDGIARLRVTCTVNGIRRQDASAGEMIFTVPQMIEHLSTAMTLLPGDVIFTGTPAGVGVAREPPLFLFPGDTVTCEVSGLGAISQTIVAGARETLIV
jgi:2-keto-4-pentenoate hydratase/2-oxohepta-3-ene-1,7-dioic acid hydratase in catechol pathway